MVKVPGGWLKFSMALGRCDAHCARHGLGCKMDRVLRKQPIGRHMAWLSDTSANKAQHDAAKSALAEPSSELAVKRGREAFVKLAREKKGLFQTILDEEAKYEPSAGIDVD